MMKRIVVVAVVALAMTTALAHAQDVKVGVNLPYTGIGAEFAQLVDRGMELYLKLNADKVKPYKITLIKRDVKDPSGANAKIAVQELLTQDNVDVLAAFLYVQTAEKDQWSGIDHARFRGNRRLGFVVAWLDAAGATASPCAAAAQDTTVGQDCRRIRCI